MCNSVKAGVGIWIWGKSQQRSACPLFQVQSSPISWNAQVMPGLAPPWPTMVGYEGAEAKQLCKLWFVRLWRRRGRTILDQHPAPRIKYRVLCFSKKCWINTKTWDVSGTKRNRFLGKTGKGSTNSKSWINHCDRLNSIFVLQHLSHEIELLLIINPWRCTMCTTQWCSLRWYRLRLFQFD